MKAIFTIVFFSTWLMTGLSAQKSSRDSISVTILLRNKQILVDSVFVIFDRYDLTGAGVINKVFYPSNNKIVIEKVPIGKYYVDVYGIGIDRQNIAKISTIGERRSNILRIPIKTFETHSPGNAVIPVSAIDFSNLVVTQKNLRR